MRSSGLALALTLPVALAGARLGPTAGAAAGLAAGVLQAFVWSRLEWSEPGASVAFSAAVLILLGAIVGKAAARQRDDGLALARGVWTALRAAQVREFLSYVLYQLREYQISATSLVEALALSTPKEDPGLQDRIARLRRVIAELNAKTTRLLGEKSGVTTQSRGIVTVDLGVLTRETADQARVTFAAEKVTLNVLEHGMAPQATCDAAVLRASLFSVLQNALEACSARGGGSVSIIVRQQGERGELEIVDDGGGIAASIDTLFEPFFAARAGSSGLGLGLPMARRMMERLGGTVRVKSQGLGTAALIELPLSRDLPFVRNEESTWAGRRKAL